MVNCLDCEFSYLNSWNKWRCALSHTINVDEEGFITDEEIECEDFVSIEED